MSHWAASVEIFYASQSAGDEYFVQHWEVGRVEWTTKQPASIPILFKIVFSINFVFLIVWEKSLIFYVNQLLSYSGSGLSNPNESWFEITHSNYWKLHTIFSTLNWDDPPSAGNYYRKARVWVTQWNWGNALKYPSKLLWKRWMNFKSLYELNLNATRKI